MALDIDTNIKLPIPSSFSRSPIVDLQSGSGIERIYKSQNTLIDKLRGPLICDEYIELATTAQTGEYRVRVHGDGGGISAGEPAGAWANATVPAGSTLTTRIVSSLNTITNVHTVPSVATWEEFTGTDSLIDDTSAEYEGIVVDLSVQSGTGTLHSVSLSYKRGRTILLDGPRDDGLTGMDATRATGESVFSAARLHHMHQNARELAKIRQGTIIQKAWYDDANGYAPDPGLDGPLIFLAYAPLGVTEARFYIRRNAGAAGVSDMTISSRDVALNVIDSVFETAIGTGVAWTSAIDLDLVQGLNLFVVEANNTTKVHTISGWFKDAAYPP